ncbi:MAG: 5,10-methylenetetrahydrofolate reductase, partial [Acidimicrobiales bacterium]
DTLRRSLHAKQALLAEAGVGGRVTTQMCFAAATIRSWLEAERAAGLTLPVNLGVAGAVDRRKLLAMGMAVGVGTSMRYLKKNRSALGRLVTSARYNPSKLIDAMTDDLVALDIAGLHIFTFNQVAATLEWRDRVLRRLQRS